MGVKIILRLEWV